MLPLLFLAGPELRAQSLEKSAREQQALKKPAYLELSAGLNYAFLRDAGVSPLLYGGPLFFTQAAFLKETPKMEWRGDFGFAVGEIEVARSFIVPSDVTAFYHGFSALRTVLERKEGRLKLQGGLQYHGFSNYRVTPAFRNNSSVVESVNTVFAALKGDWTLHRQFRPGKFLIFRRSGGPRTFRLSSQVSLPLLHSAWRPDFAYLDDFTGGEDAVGVDNRLQFGGWRFMHKTEFWYYLRNGNAWKIGYLWDAQRSPGTLNRFETGQHITQLSLMVKLN